MSEVGKDEDVSCLGGREPRRVVGFRMCFWVLFFYFFRAAPAACGNSLAGSQIGAAAAGLHHSHSHGNRGPNHVCILRHSSRQHIRSLTH